MNYPCRMTYLLSALIVGGIAVAPRLSGLLEFPPPRVAIVELPDTSMIPLEELPDLEEDRKREVPPVETQAGTEMPSASPLESVAVAASPVETINPPLERSSGPSTVFEMPQMDPVLNLPEEKRKQFMALERLGRKLYEDGAPTPAYWATIPIRVADKLVRTGILMPAVLVNERVFIFQGGDLSSAHAPRLAGNPDLIDFSNRFIALPEEQGAHLVRQVSQRLGMSNQSLRACLMVRTDVDRMVLAAQQQASDALGVSLGETAFTYGRFDLANNVPFQYIVSELVTMDKRRHRVLPDGERTSESSTERGRS